MRDGKREREGWKEERGEGIGGRDGMVYGMKRGRRRMEGGKDIGYGREIRMVRDK